VTDTPQDTPATAAPPASDTTGATPGGPRNPVTVRAMTAPTPQPAGPDSAHEDELPDDPAAYADPDQFPPAEEVG
jgi:hypothetical protein